MMLLKKFGRMLEEFVFYIFGFGVFVYGMLQALPGISLGEAALLTAAGLAIWVVLYFAAGTIALGLTAACRLAWHSICRVVR